MATISSPGIGSGLDIKSIVSQLVALEKVPLDNLKLQAATVQTKISVYGEIKSLVSKLSDAASKLGSLTTYTAVSASSSKPDLVSVSAGGGTAANSFGISVDRLAQAQSYASVSLDGSLPIGQGTLSIQPGRYNSTPTFAASVGVDPITIDIEADDTLADVASKINSQNAGVTATLLNDGSGQRLLLTSKTTGEAAGFELTVTDSDGNNTDASGLSRLVNGGTVTQYGQDAAITVNGSIAVTSSSNTFKDVVSGLSLTLSDNATVGTTAQINVAANNGTVRTAVEEFVAAYNTLNNFLNEATKFDPAQKSAGLLQGDSTAVGLQNALRGMLQSTMSGSQFGRLADIGVTALRGGNLEIDNTKFTAALSNTDELNKFFRTDNGNPLSNGFALKLKNFAQGLLATDGLFKNKQDALERALNRNSSDQERVNAKVARIEAQLNRRYSALDAQVASLTALNNYVAQQVTMWNNAKSN
ncbi:flagellar filament capping protein FliD [Aquabacterium sp. A08]|uniref:flagellar filament capping protein FliD n=1 Tax=Aquabacterium sp. A08 TaxID=2718532 RepID=UPI0014247A03|nr:flagellar filament capping protein FliD [Aquabacterium sp. A08]NIC41921.1 flagellar filament capping protein FliD [Aquabacterium sp. A08]NIC41964.1 flagellar filament capping protein FliD [Aquabacterium sp. A08]